MKRWMITALLGFALTVGTLGCKEHDIGKPCQPDAGQDLPIDPIPGETPVIEVVAMQRSTACETFQCLSHGGYDSYCTRTCSYDIDEKIGPACTADADCKRPRHCYEGRCRDDDCPEGFECRPVQDVGPLNGQLFCVYKEGCGHSNSECEALGEMECRRLGCFDASLLSTDAATPHFLACYDHTELSFCECPDGTFDCDGSELRCDPDGLAPFPEGAVEVRDVCMRTES